jgi:hypothetical protein
MFSIREEVEDVELDKSEKRFLFIVVGLMFVMYIIWHIGAHREAVEPEPANLVSGVDPGFTRWQKQERLMKQKFYAPTTDILWCTTQEDDFGLSLTRGRYIGEDLSSPVCPVRRDGIYG